VAAGNREAARSTLALALGDDVTADAVKAQPEWANLALEPDFAVLLDVGKSASASSTGAN
jgi:hypothetical protein